MLEKVTYVVSMLVGLAIGWFGTQFIIEHFFGK